MSDRLEVMGIGEPMALFEATGEGSLDHARSFVLRMAGAEANLLIGAARQGHRAALLSAVGADPFGRFVLATLAEQQVVTDYVHVDHDAPTGIFFKEVTGDDRRRVHYYRQGSAASRLGPDALEPFLRAPPRMLVVSGLTLGLGGTDGLGATARLALERSRQLSVTTIFDANLRPTLWWGTRALRDFAALQPCFDIVLASRDELAALMPGSEPLEAAQALTRQGCRGVILKNGARGATVVDATGVVEVPALPVAEPVDPVGAGDAFGAGVTVGLLRGWPLVDAARLGAVLGAEVVAARGDWEGLPGRERADALLEVLPPVRVVAR